jgi:hypothetical protein
MAWGGAVGRCVAPTLLAVLLVRCIVAGAATMTSPPQTGPRPPEESRHMAEDNTRFVGTWRKAENPDCAALYPAVLQLEANGLYRGHAEPPAQFTTWDVGTWRATDADHLAISTANDAVVNYGFQLAGNTLSFTDPGGCRFSYRREG